MSTAAAAGRIMQRLEQLAALTQDAPRLTRVFLSPEHRAANGLVAGWMREAGMHTSIDALGNVCGRREGDRPGLPAVLLGSHLDTVRDAGRYDGMLGVVTAIECVQALHRPLPFAVEVIGFGDEEGVRFGSTLLGSRAVAGTLDPAVFTARDAQGITLAQALEDFGLDPARWPAAARRRDELLAYIELHIEQGPVLEREAVPVGCVTSINGATRLSVQLLGTAGHAGTVPMDSRHDALAAAAEMVLAVETRCRAEPLLVGTVGRLEVLPGAVNVIPGECGFTIDLRAPADAQRIRAVADVRVALDHIAARRGVSLAVKVLHESRAAPCAPWLMERIEAAIAAQGITPLRLPSGAGHDAMALAALVDVGMIFVRCTGGISHNPAESISVTDAGAGFETLRRLLADLDPAARY